MMTRVKVENWRGHLAAAQERSMPLAQYAREQGLSPHTLYVARRQLQAQGSRAPKVAPTRGGGAGTSLSPFVAVRLTPSAAGLRARLPNGVELEWSELDAATRTQLIELLARLPCSA